MKRRSAEAQRAYRKKPGVKEREQQYKRMKFYGLSQDEFQAMLNAQDNKCYICKSDFNFTVPCVDHAHDDKKTVRGLLCRLCNGKLGWYEKHKTLIGEYVGEAS